MQSMLLRGLAASVVCLVLGSNSAWAQGPKINALGAEMAGNAAGTIPEWTGGLTKAPVGFDPKKGYLDPFAAEKPLYTITQANLAQYEKLLPAGQIALLKRYSSYSIPVYKTHRTAAFSPEMMMSIDMEGNKPKLAHGGLAVEGVQSTSVPFPEPKNGLEAVWNTLLRRPAQSMRSHTASFVAGNGTKPLAFASSQTIAWAPAIGKAGTTLLFGLIGESTRPSAQSGEALLVMDTLNFKDDARNAWVVNSGQRRVLRAPELVHAAPAGNSDALRTVDDIYGFNGSPERFEWKLLGKREMLIPYNSNRLHTPTKDSDVLLANHLNPDHVRWELHRVWVVEATLKPGTSHVYTKRTFYIDEDSWSIMLTDKYDSRGQLWRTAEMHSINYADIPMLISSLEVHYDLQSGRYLAMGLRNEEKAVYTPIKRSNADFSPNGLRRAGTR